MQHTVPKRHPEKPELTNLVLKKMNTVTPFSVSLDGQTGLKTSSSAGEGSQSFADLLDSAAFEDTGAEAPEQTADANPEPQEHSPRDDGAQDRSAASEVREDAPSAETQDSNEDPIAETAALPAAPSGQTDDSTPQSVAAETRPLTQAAEPASEAVEGAIIEGENLAAATDAPATPTGSNTPEAIDTTTDTAALDIESVEPAADVSAEESANTPPVLSEETDALASAETTAVDTGDSTLVEPTETALETPSTEIPAETEALASTEAPAQAPTTDAQDTAAVAEIAEAATTAPAATASQATVAQATAQPRTSQGSTQPAEANGSAAAPVDAADPLTDAPTDALASTPAKSADAKDAAGKDSVQFEAKTAQSPGGAQQDAYALGGAQKSGANALPAGGEVAALAQTAQPAASTAASTLADVFVTPQTADAGQPTTPLAPASQPLGQSTAQSAPERLSVLQSPRAAADDFAALVARRTTGGKSEFQIRLDPPELGRVDVKLEVNSDGALRAQVTGDRVEAVELLQRDAKALERALMDAGFTLDKDSLNFASREDRRSGQGAGDTAAAPDEDPAVSGSEAPEDIIITEASGVIRGVDIRI